MSDDRVDILLVDDNPNDVELTLHALKKNGFDGKVHIARDGAEALEYIFGTGAYSERQISFRRCKFFIRLQKRLLVTLTETGPLQTYSLRIDRYASQRKHSCRRR
jgi:CheY-like chemotaxis protein